jgi:hypothetical protein
VVVVELLTVPVQRLLAFSLTAVTAAFLLLIWPLERIAHKEAQQVCSMQ